MFKKEISEKEWKEILEPKVFHILREKGTEPAFSGKYYYEKKDGTYICAGCGNVLFSSKAKYESGSGWPSFFEPFSDDAVKEFPDNSFDVERTEVVCGNCGGHLGHVFDDGPPPTGLRYCINSLSLVFEER